MQKHRKYQVDCHRLGWTFRPFVVDVFGGFAQDARDLVALFLKGLLGQREGWQRRPLEATVWQDLSFTVMREIGRQLVWSVQGLEGADDMDEYPTHQPYAA